MELIVGSVLQGKVTGITKFGAFIALPDNKSGMVHISEIAGSYVNDIKDHLKEGQMVTVKLIGIDENGRLSLSIKRVAEQPQGAKTEERRGRPQGEFQGPARKSKSEPETFEDRLKQFMSDSESKISTLTAHSDRRGSGSRRPRSR